MPEYAVFPNDVQIIDSYKVRKWYMRSVLKNIKRDHEDETTVFERSIFSLKMEWICHNFLYNVGYQRERTRDVDLDNPSDHPEWIYILGGMIVWIFVW